MVQNVLFLVLETVLVSAMVLHTLDVQVALLAHPVLQDNIVLMLVNNSVVLEMQQTLRVVIRAIIAHTLVLMDILHLRLLHRVVLDIL